MNDEQPPELPRGRRRLREPDPATPPSRPAPRRADPRDPRAAEPRAAEHRAAEHRAADPRAAEPRAADPRAGVGRAAEPRAADPRAADPRAAEHRRAPGQSGAHELPQPTRRGPAPEPPPPPSRRAPGHSGQYEQPRPMSSGAHELPQPSRRARPAEPPAPDPRRDAPPSGRRRRLEPPDTPPPAGDELDAQARRAAPARAAHARHGLDEGAEVPAPPRRRRAAPEPAESRPPRRRAAPEPESDAAAEPPRRRVVPEPAEVAPPRRRAAPEPDEVAEAPPRRRAVPEPDEAREAPAPPRRRAAPEPPAAAQPLRRQPGQPGDVSAGVPADAEPPRRARRPPPPPVREEPVTEIIPAQAPPPAEPAPSHEPQDGYDEYADYDDEYADGYDEAEYEDDDYEDEDYEDEPKKPRKKSKRALGWIAAVAVIALLAGGAWYGFNSFFGYDDFEGSGDGDVLFQVDDGDSTSAIGAKLATAGVVASGKAFVKAGADNPKLSRIQHGFYVMKSHMSGASAVDRIVSPTARVGQLEVRPYTQFDDITQPDGKVTPGVYSLMAKASCAQLNGKSTCVTADDLRKAVDAADLKTLGVPDWAVGDANKADRKDRRLEGLIAPGIYDVRPGATPPEIIGQLVRTSTEAIQNAGLGAQSAGPGMTPYQTLIIASIIEREAVKADFPKLSRVIYNRLAVNMRLQMDSTVNYVLDRPTLLTDETERIKSGAYNTYKNSGLPPTPIAVASPEAIKAAVHPPEGDWVYFVKCEKNGLSCFAVTNDEHNKNRDLARERGVI
jgi:UPF0755 protein